MPRIRSIKPEFPEDETLGLVSRDARFLYILIWTRCDDLGRFRASPALLASQLYPYDEDVTVKAIGAWIEELVAVERLKLYEVNGQQYAEVVRWGKHQRIDNASKQNLMPTPPWAADDDGSPPPAAGRRDSPPGEGALAAGEERSGEEWEGSGGGTAATSRAESALMLIAERVTAQKPRKNATRYRAAVMVGLRKERSLEALDFAIQNPTWTPEDIAEALEPTGAVRVIRAPDPDCSVCHGSGSDPDDEEVPCSCKYRRTA